MCDVPAARLKRKLVAIPDELLAELEQEEDSSEEAAEPVEQVVSQERPVDIEDCRSYPSSCAFGTHQHISLQQSQQCEDTFLKLSITACTPLDLAAESRERCWRGQDAKWHIPPWHLLFQDYMRRRMARCPQNTVQ